MLQRKYKSDNFKKKERPFFIMPKISEQKKSQRRDQILHAAFQCFVEKGYEQTTMREIFDKAALSAGAVYLYFKSKEEIIQALAKAGKWHFERVCGDFEKDENPLRNVLGELSNLIDKKGGDVGIKLEVSLLAASLNDNKLKEILRDKLHHDVSLVEKLIRKSDFHDLVDKALLARVIVGAIQGLSIQKMLDPDISTKNIFKGLKW